MTKCCGGTCARRRPILIRQGPLSGRWFAITGWQEVGVSTDKGTRSIIQSTAKHDITDELTTALLDAGWTPPTPRAQGDRSRPAPHLQE